jgi:hypothetical protein
VITSPGVAWNVTLADPSADPDVFARACGDCAEFWTGTRPSGQGEDDGVQGQPHARPHHRAIDADVLQIASEEELQLA